MMKKRILKPSKILAKLSQQSVDKMRDRINENNVEIIAIGDFYVSLRGKTVRKPIFFEKELISEFKSIEYKTRAIGYTTALAEMACRQDCMIVVVNRQQAHYFKNEIMRIASQHVNPNCWQKLLIKLGF